MRAICLVGEVKPVYENLKPEVYTFRKDLYFG